MKKIIDIFTDKLYFNLRYRFKGEYITQVPERLQSRNQRKYATNSK